MSDPKFVCPPAQTFGPDMPLVTEDAQPMLARRVSELDDEVKRLSKTEKELRIALAGLRASVATFITDVHLHLRAHPECVTEIGFALETAKIMLAKSDTTT